MTDELVQRMTASMVPHPMYASGWNACLDACSHEIERLREDVADARRKCAEYESMVAAREAELKDMRDERDALRAEVGKLRVQRAGEDVRLADAISERDRLRAEMATIRNLQTVAESALAAMRAEVAELRGLRQRGSTHSDGCYALGPRHYECALNEIDALTALRKRVEEARVVNTVVEYANGEKMIWLEDDCMPLDSEGKRVALVVLGEG